MPVAAKSSRAALCQKDMRDGCRCCCGPKVGAGLRRARREGWLDGSTMSPYEDGMESIARLELRVACRLELPPTGMGACCAEADSNEASRSGCSCSASCEVLFSRSPSRVRFGLPARVPMRLPMRLP